MTTSDGRNDFDFLQGRWRIVNRRLVARLRGSDQWNVFEATGVNWPILGGLGNIDTFATTMPDGKPINGASLRIFNPATGLWKIYWIDDRRCELTPPVAGRFVDGVGQFDGEDIEGDIPVRVRFAWSAITPESARWQQAFSTDDGATWETNWIMEFHREPEIANP